MGKDFESWLHQWQPDGQFSHAKSLKLSPDPGMQNPDIPCAIPCTNAVPLNRAMPAFGSSGLPHFRQGLIPDMTLHEKFLPKLNLPIKVPPIIENCSEANTLVDGGHALKRYLLFDQTGSKTTMVYSPGIGPPIQQPNPWSLRPTGYHHNMSLDDEVKIGSSVYYHSGPSFANELDENHGTNDGSEMCEDSEEINALLYSDDEDSYSEDGEETSTGHSPGTMTAYEKHDWFEEDDMDEVASSAGPVKRQKLSDSGYEVPSVTYASSSIKPNRSQEYEDDAASSCVGGKPIQCSNGMGSLSGNKRLRKEKLHETVSILQTIIPGGKGKDAVMVLDEAIDYLRALKFKAESLGFSAL